MTKKLPAAVLGAVAGAALAGAAITSAYAADPAERVFKGKRVTIVVGFDAGGTYGLYAQLFARHMVGHIPGAPTIVVQYMPGGGGLKASNFAYRVMPKNGLNWFSPPDSLVLSNLLEPDKARYDSRKFHFLGNAVQTNAVIAVRGDKGVRSVEALRRVPVVMGSTGTGSQTFLVPATLNAVLGTKIKIVQGYKGSRNMIQAIDQKEIDGGSLSWGAWTTAHARWFESGKMVAIGQIGTRAEAGLEKVPMVDSLAANEEDRQMINLIASLGVIGRSLVLPPGVPAALGASLRSAYAATVKDPAFIDEAAKRRLALDPMLGADLQGHVERMMNVSKSVVTRARNQIMKPARAS